MHRPTNLALLGLGILIAALPAPARTADDAPLLARKGGLLLETAFDETSFSAPWTRQFGKLEIADGALRASQQASDKHPCAFRRPLPLQDAVVQVDFRFQGARMLHVGFDPARGELKKTGHLFSLVLTPERMALLEHQDKSNPASKNQERASASASFEPGKWYTLVLEMKGPEVAAHVVGIDAKLRASSPDFACKKPGLVFRVMSPDDGSAHLDNLKVWRAQQDRK
ncbi:MAG: hypothetical protein ACO1SX_12595 [Actinomycetota bacterium]